MKYLKPFNENWKNFKEDIEEISELYSDFFDEYNFIEWNKSFDGSRSFHDERGTSFNIQRGYCYNAECIKIRIHFGMGADYRNKNIKIDFSKSCFENFDLILDPKAKGLLEECHSRVISVLKPVDTIIGAMDKCLDILYFIQTPNFERHKGVNIYGSNYQLEVPGLGNLSVNSSHLNIISIKTKEGLISCCLMCYLDGNYYYLPNFIFPHIIMYSYSGNRIEKWIEEEWTKACKKFHVRKSTKGRGTLVNDNPQIMPSEFMVWLKNNIGNLK